MSTGTAAGKNGKMHHDKQAQSTVVKKSGPSTVLVELPVGLGVADAEKWSDTNFMSINLSLRDSVRMRKAFARLYEGCRGMELSNGRLVDSQADAIRFMLERIYDKLPA